MVAECPLADRKRATRELLALRRAAGLDAEPGQVVDGVDGFEMVAAETVLAEPQGAFEELRRIGETTARLEHAGQLIPGPRPARIAVRDR